jgi:hypothetical protein
MKSRRMSTQLLKCLDALADHRLRAAAVAGLLERCDEADLPEGMLAGAAGIITDELRRIRQCAEEIQKEVCR